MSGTDDLAERGPRALVTTVRMFFGAAGILLGMLPAVTVPTVEPSADWAGADWHTMLFAAVLLGGGMVLLAAPHRWLRVSARAWAVGAAIALAGLLLSAVVPVGQACCDTQWTVTLGLPLPWATGGGQTLGSAVGAAWNDSWSTLSAVADLVFWAYAGMVVVVVRGLARQPEGGRHDRTHRARQGP